MSLLDRIVEAKRQQLTELRLRKPLEDLAAEIPEAPPPSFQESLRADGVNIIAEIKYSSPSHGPFLIQEPPEDVASAYRDHGAAAVSVLTDEPYFQGKAEYLARIRDRFPDLPLLRKDFTLDRYQVLEARVLGASAVLLIAACLDLGRLRQLQKDAAECRLDALVEIHDLFELETALEAGARIIGVNNRDLRSFRIDIDVSFRVARELEGEEGVTLVSESGISEPAQIHELRAAGFHAFLVGSTLMDSENPGQDLRRLIEG